MIVSRAKLWSRFVKSLFTRKVSNTFSSSSLICIYECIVARKINQYLCEPLREPLMQDLFIYCQAVSLLSIWWLLKATILSMASSSMDMALYVKLKHIEESSVLQRAKMLTAQGSNLLQLQRMPIVAVQLPAADRAEEDIAHTAVKCEVWVHKGWQQDKAGMKCCKEVMHQIGCLKHWKGFCLANFEMYCAKLIEACHKKSASRTKLLRYQVTSCSKSAGAAYLRLWRSLKLFMICLRARLIVWLGKIPLRSLTDVHIRWRISRHRLRASTYFHLDRSTDRCYF